jgi:hypothetical protein
MSHSSRKSLYIFLSCILGSMLFLILHRLVYFVYSMLLDRAYSIFSFGLSPLEFMALDYLTMILAFLLGGWYGIWLGIYWYDMVYEKGYAGGLVDHVASHVFHSQPTHVPSANNIRILATTRKIEHDLDELESLADTGKVELKSPAPIKRKIARKPAAVKIAL